jgi:hypothetical protein
VVAAVVALQRTVDRPVHVLLGGAISCHCSAPYPVVCDQL